MLTGLVWAKPDPSLTPEARKNIEEACGFLTRFGERSVAQDMLTLMQEGKLRMAKLSEENAETDVEKGTVTLDSSSLGGRYSPTSHTGRCALLSIAKTLYHERIHLREQRPLEVRNSNLQDVVGDNPAELAAWNRTLKCLELWANIAEIRGDKECRTYEEQLQAYIDARTLLDIEEQEIKDFPGKGYGELTPPSPHKTVQAWLQTLAKRKKNIDQLVRKTKDAIAAQDTPSGNQQPTEGSETASAPLLSQYLSEVEARRAALKALYDYGTPSTNSLLKSMKDGGVQFAQQYAQSWSDNGIYLLWSEVDKEFYAPHAGKLQSLLADHPDRRADTETQRAMEHWRKLDQQISSVLERFLLSNVQFALLVDREHEQGSSSELWSEKEQIQQRQEAIRKQLRALQKTDVFSVR